MRGLRTILHGEGRPLALLVGAFAFLLFIALAISETADMVTLVPGEVAPSQIVAPRKAVNTPLYNQMKREARASVQPVYVANPDAETAAVEDVNALVQAVLNVKSQLPPKPTATGEVAAWQTQVGLPIPASAISDILVMSPTDIRNLGSTAGSIVNSVLSAASYRSSQVPNEQGALDERVAALALPNRSETLFLEAVVNEVARPNLTYSASQTEKARTQAEDGVVPPVIPQGTVLVQKGQRITSADVMLLRAMGLTGGFPWGPLAAALLLSILFTAATALYVDRFRPGLRGDLSRLFTTGLLVLLTVVAGRILEPISPLLVPLAFLGTMAGTLLGSRMALFLVLAVGLLVTVGLNLTPQATVILVGGSMAGVFATGRLRDRSDLLRAPIWIGGVNLLLVFAVEVLAASLLTSTSPVWGDLLWAVVSAVLSTVMTIGFLPFFETYLGVLSPLRLLELSNPNQPLLKKLMLEAPGTYHHSLIVSNLAVGAAEEIGADSLLCRVGAYYHDIGKTLRPAFFVDNQMGGENPHDKIAPSLSALIIESHVKDGLAMAEDARLPKEIQAFIGEHHGTNLVTFFYHKALEQSGDAPVAEHDYRYPGPRPQSRETAIVMLADGAEAIARSLKGPTPQKIEAAIRKLIKDRLDDGQLDESGLNLRDLEMITRAFTRVLQGVYHTRVEYPDPKEILERRQIGHGRVAKPADRR